MYKRIVEQTMV